MSTIVNFLNQEKAKVVSPSELKVGKKTCSAFDFYKLHLAEFSDFGINLKEFEKELSEIYKNQGSEKYGDKGALEALLFDLKFIADKFRWFVTKDLVCVYYVKCRLDAEEYKFVTTDPMDPKFLNALSIEEIEIIRRYLNLYNLSNEPIKRDKVLFLLISNLRESRHHQLACEIVTLTNNPTRPAFKYFDIGGIVKRGKEYQAENGGEPPPTPAWDSFFSRIRNQAMVPVTKAYLAGLFIAGNKTKQALYIYGTGNDGKTQVTAALVEFMGQEVTFPLPQNMKSNQFTLADAYGKRMFIGEELQSPNVIRTGLLHAILGGSLARIENKNERAFMATLYSCGVITSNYLPEIADVKNQKCRLLYIEMNSASSEEIQSSGKQWSQTLISEMEFMIYKGYLHYKELNKDGAEFLTPENYTEELAGLFDEKSEFINSFVDRVFISDPSSSIKYKLKNGLIQYVKNNHPDISYLRDFTDHSLNKEIFEKLTLKYPGLEKIRITFKGEKVFAIKGLGIAQEFLSLGIEIFNFESE